MSDQVTTAFVQQYKAGWEHLVQQRGSKLRDCVRVESQVGKASFYDQVDATTVRKRTVRHGDSPYIATPHARRQCVLQDYDWGDFVDDEDKIRTLNDPTNPYVMAGAYAMGRAMDQEVVDAFEGTAKTGEAGGTSLTFSADTTPTAGSEEGYTIVHNSTGLVMVKLLQAKEILDDNETDEEEERFIACTAGQITDLFNTTEIPNSDYNTVKALAQGKVDTFLGFTFKRISSDILSLSGTTRNVLCWVKSGMLLGIGRDTTARITEREDKGFATYVFNSMSIGSTRMQGKKTVIIECTE